MQCKPNLLSKISVVWINIKELLMCNVVVVSDCFLFVSETVFSLEDNLSTSLYGQKSWLNTYKGNLFLFSHSYFLTVTTTNGEKSKHPDVNHPFASILQS